MVSISCGVPRGSHPDGFHFDRAARERWRGFRQLRSCEEANPETSRKTAGETSAGVSRGTAAFSNRAFRSESDKWALHTRPEPPPAALLFLNSFTQKTSKFNILRRFMDGPSAGLQKSRIRSRLWPHGWSVPILHLPLRMAIRRVWHRSSSRKQPGHFLMGATFMPSGGEDCLLSGGRLFSTRCEEILMRAGVFL